MPPKVAFEAALPVQPKILAVKNINQEIEPEEKEQEEQCIGRKR